jgi:hypothetical protein
MERRGKDTWHGIPSDVAPNPSAVAPHRKATLRRPGPYRYHGGDHVSADSLPIFFSLSLRLPSLPLCLSLSLSVSPPSLSLSLSLPPLPVPLYPSVEHKRSALNCSCRTLVSMSGTDPEHKRLQISREAASCYAEDNMLFES